MINAKDDSEEINMISDEDNESTPVAADVTEEQHDCLLDCLEPWSAGLWPFYNCLKFYDTLYMIRRRNCVSSDGGKFDNRYTDFSISSVPRPVNRPATTSANNSFSSPSPAAAAAPRLAVSRAVSTRNIQKAGSFQSPRRVPPTSSPSFRNGRYGVEPNEL